MLAIGSTWEVKCCPRITLLASFDILTLVSPLYLSITFFLLPPSGSPGMDPGFLLFRKFEMNYIVPFAPDGLPVFFTPDLGLSNCYTTAFGRQGPP